MGALQTLLACAERGVLVSVSDDGNLHVRPKEKLTPELRAALRECKDELVNGKSAPRERFEILSTRHSEGWWAVFLKGKKKNSRFELEPLSGWALVHDHDTGLTLEYGMVVGDVAGPVCYSNDFCQYVHPSDLEDMREQLIYENRELKALQQEFEEGMN
jgi:TubC N-terminal docking domain